MAASLRLTNVKVRPTGALLDCDRLYPHIF